MSDIIKQEAIEYDGNIKVNASGSPILGRLSGPCADIVNQTRNGRKYSEELWEKVFKDPIVEEYFDCGGILGELNHPENRTETDLSKVCVCMSEPPKKENGQLVGKWDILDTPNGRILKCLCDYGYKIGVSSRGTGDVVTDFDGNEAVDPDTYEFTAFDIVLLPAVKAARLDYVTESLNNRKSLKVALTEAMNKSTEDEKKIMEETLKTLDINLTENLQSSSSEDGVDINASNNTNAASSIGADVVKSLQETLKRNTELEKEIVELQEKLSVCYAKEASNEELQEKLSSSEKQLNRALKASDSLRERISLLTEKLNKSEDAVNEKSKLVESVKNARNDEQKKSVQSIRSLSESLKSKTAEVSSLKNKVGTLNEQINSLKKQSEEEISKLNESVADLQKDLSIKNKEYSQKLAKANQLVEKYKSVAQKAVDRYIEMQALRLGVSSQMIVERLSKSYTFDNIDEVCENLQSYQVSRTRLPFDIQSNKPIKVKVKESKETIVPNNVYDDEIDSSLEMLAGLNNLN